jgi:hypothetical protein
VGKIYQNGLNFQRSIYGQQYRKVEKLNGGLGSNPTSPSAAEVGDSFSMHIHEGGRVAKYELIRLEELLFNKTVPRPASSGHVHL